ncbi:MAG: tRNA (guanosine(46)-N7)-methyltransferase TrmB [Verrucomicrobiota bacterium]
MSDLRRNGKLRWVPSYLRNQGQLTRSQKRAFRDHWPRFGLTWKFNQSIDLAEAFSECEGPLLIEIGFGMGDHLVALAEKQAHSRILGIEVHRPGLAAACGKLASAEIQNVRLVRGDARLVLEDHLPRSVADAILVPFPEPWPKPEDQHRRLLSPGLIDLVEKTLKPSGIFHAATDIENYASAIDSMMKARSGWESVALPAWLQREKPTLYEQKGLAAGREIHDLTFARRAKESTDALSDFASFN